MLCDAACMARVDSLPETVTPSGLKFRDIAVGKGPTPPTGYQARPQGCRLSRLGMQCPGAGALACFGHKVHATAEMSRKAHSLCA